MTAVRCETHGIDCTGPHACDHVQAATYGKGPMPAYYDFTIDSRLPWKAVACDPCMRALNVSPGGTLGLGDFSRGPAVDLVPVCGRCFRREV